MSVESSAAVVREMEERRRRAFLEAFYAVAMQAGYTEPENWDALFRRLFALVYRHQEETGGGELLRPLEVNDDWWTPRPPAHRHHGRARTETEGG